MKTKPKRRIDLLKSANYQLAASTGQLRFGRWRSGETMLDRRKESKRRACRKGNYND